MGEEGQRLKASRRRRRRRVVGTAPGTVTVDPTAPKPVIHVLAYGPDDFVEQPIADPGEVREFLGKWPVTWINVDGLGDAETIRALGEIFGLHQLALEDVANVYQRPKVEEYGERLFVIVRMMTVNTPALSEQVSLFLGKGFVLTFQERPGDCFDPVRERIRHARGRVRQAGADYLAYALLDSVVDAYFPIIEHYGDQLESMESQVFGRPDTETAAAIHRLKRQVVNLRRVIWPLREAVNALLRDSSPLITDDTRIYLRDCYDHAFQIMDLVETHRESASDLMNLYLTCVSNRMNEVMKVLTVIATIFIPLTFIAGIYGMNFDRESPLNMPELGWDWGYPACLAAMLVVTIGMLIFFRRKGWLGGSGPEGTGASSGGDRPGDRG